MSFAGRLVLGTVGVLLLTVAILVWLAEVSLRRDLESEIRGALTRDARLIREVLPPDSLAWQATAVRFARLAGMRVTIIDSVGRVRAESDLQSDDLAALENHLHRPEVQQALHDSVGSNRRRSATVGRPLLYVAVRGGPGFVRVATDLTQVDATVHRAQRSVLWAALLALLVGGALALVAGGSVARPLIRIEEAAREIAAGGTPHFPQSRIADIDALVRAMRRMHEELASRFEALRLSREESSALVESMAEGVLAADARGRIVRANGAARAMLGYPEQAALPDLPQLFREKTARGVVDRVMAGRAVDGEEADLDNQVVLMTARPLPAGGAVLVLHEVTALRRLETVRRDFVANVSHELKTPLTVISGYAETLLSESPDPADARRFVEVIHGNAKRMQRLVDDLLDLSRIESGGWVPRPEEVDLAALVRDLGAGFADPAAAGRVELRSSIEPAASRLTADPDALRQVLGNLIDNALRYTPPGGHITVRATREGAGIALTVEDTGSGIPGEHLPRIFERFYRVDSSRARSGGGTGLGLAIVKHLVEAHGGRVRAESELGAGTRMICWFPRTAVPV